jgi:hypothetical protein
MFDGERPHNRLPAVLVTAALAVGFGCEPDPDETPTPEAPPCDVRADRRVEAPLPPDSGSDTHEFVDVTEDAGLAWLPTVDSWEELQAEAPDRSEDFNQWGGFAVADFDGDGALDILFTNKYDSPRLFLAIGPLQFQELSAEDAGLEAPPGQLSGASAADFDGDGDMDVLMVGRVTILLENIGGDPRFEPSELITDPLGTAFSIELSASWADVDRDGDLDVYIANWGWDPRGNSPQAHDRFLIQGDSGFEDRIETLLPPALDGSGYIGGWSDVDADGDLDFMLIQEADRSGEGANVFARHQGTFGDDLAFEIESVGVEVPGRAMGVGYGDYDLDGDIDIHVTDIGPTKLFEQRGGTFIDVSTAFAADLAPAEYEGSWATFFVDVDNDGTQELYTSFGVLTDHAIESPEHIPQRDRLWSRGSDGAWSDVGVASGLTDTGSTRGALAVDLDADGCMDILSFRLMDGPLLMKGVCPPGNGWVNVDLEMSEGANPNGVGARITAHAGAQYLGVREIYAGSVGVYTGGPPEVHFGLGAHETVDIRVQWPDGTTTCNLNLPTRSRIHLSK